MLIICLRLWILDQVLLVNLFIMAYGSGMMRLDSLVQPISIQDLSELYTATCTVFMCCLEEMSR